MGRFAHNITIGQENQGDLSGPISSGQNFWYASQGKTIDVFRFHAGGSSSDKWSGFVANHPMLLRQFCLGILPMNYRSTAVYSSEQGCCFDDKKVTSRNLTNQSGSSSDLQCGSAEEG
jgi:hypothetical protein